jgi:hypothetical protein
MWPVNRGLNDLTPHEIVPVFGRGRAYIASESIFYRVLRRERLLKPQKQPSSEIRLWEASGASGNRPESGLELGYHMAQI